MSEEVKIEDAMPVLFIGGAKDGERVRMTALPPTKEFKVRNPLYNALLTEEGNTTSNIMFVDETYRREAFRSSAGLYPVYVLASIPSQDVVHILLENYRPTSSLQTKH